MRILQVLAAVAAIAIGLTSMGGAASAQGATGVVKERQDLMKGFFPKYLRDFSAVARGESTDISGIPAKAEAAAAEFRRIPAVFPAGSGRDVFPDSRSTPDVWAKRADFEAAAAKLATETDKLGEIAKAGNLDAVKAQVASVGQACGGCHGGPARSGGPFRFEAPQ